MDGNLYDDDALPHSSRGKPPTPTEHSPTFLAQIHWTERASTGCWTRENLAFSPLLASCWTHCLHTTRLAVAAGTERNFLTTLGDCSGSGKFFGVSLVMTTFFFSFYTCFRLSEHRFLTHRKSEYRSAHNCCHFAATSSPLVLCHVWMVFPYTTIIINCRFDVHANV